MKIPYVYLPVCALALMTANILQDYLHAFFNDYTFYLSESLLFSCFWLLFPVIAVLQGKLQEMLKGKLQPVGVAIVPTMLAVMSQFLLFALTVTLFSALFFEHTYSFMQMLTYSVANMFWPCLLLYALTCLFSYKRNRTTAGHTPVRKKEEFLIRTGRKTIPIKTEDIIFIKAESPYVAFHTIDGTHLMLGTLSSVSGQISGSFVRVHKSAIVNTAKVTMLKSRGNGDYDIVLESGDTVRMSRTYAADFKSHSATRFAP